MNSAVSIENITVKSGDLELFKNLNLEIEREKISIIVGPNGSGKTTLVKTMAGVIKPVLGKVKTHCKSMFYLPQKISYPKGITLFEYLSSIFFNGRWRWYLDAAEKEHIITLLEELELSQRRDVKLEYLSSGEIQKANIALGLLSGANLLLLDEPTSNMDLVNQMKILDILKHLKECKATILVILHDLNLASNYGDNFIGINQKREVLSASRAEFFREEVLENIFNLKFKVVDGEKNFFIQTFS